MEKMQNRIAIEEELGKSQEIWNMKVVNANAAAVVEVVIGKERMVMKKRSIEVAAGVKTEREKMVKKKSEEVEVNIGMKERTAISPVEVVVVVAIMKKMKMAAKINKSEVVVVVVVNLEVEMI